MLKLVTFWKKSTTSTRFDSFPSPRKFSKRRGQVLWCMRNVFLASKIKITRGVAVELHCGAQELRFSVLRRGTNLKNGGTNHASHSIPCSARFHGLFLVTLLSAPNSFRKRWFRIHLAKFLTHITRYPAETMVTGYASPCTIEMLQPGS